MTTKLWNKLPILNGLDDTFHQSSLSLKLSYLTGNIQECILKPLYFWDVRYNDANFDSTWQSNIWLSDNIIVITLTMIWFPAVPDCLLTEERLIMVQKRTRYRRDRKDKRELEGHIFMKTLTTYFSINVLLFLKPLSDMTN